jgi:hypothetical protein
MNFIVYSSGTVLRKENYKMRSYITFAIVAAIVSCAGCAQKQKTNPEAEKAALEAAGAWLELLDSGKYSESWEEAAGYAKALVNKEQWQKTFQGVRQPLGKLVSRELKSASYTTTVPGAPDGQYVIIQYKTSFENKASAIETVTPMLDKDGRWRVSGYYIK